MHVLAATVPAPRRPSAALEGEVVVIPAAGVAGGRDGVFGAGGRAFVGVDSHAEAASAEVVELDVPPHVVMGHVRESLDRLGSCSEDDLIDVAARLTAEMLTVAAQFPLGTILEKDGRLVRALVPVVTWRRRRRCEPLPPGDPRP